MKKKKSKHKRRPNPLKLRGRSGSFIPPEVAESMVALGIGNLVLDLIAPRPDGPRLPQIVLPKMPEEK
jgi:hypothetical protein